MRESSVKLNLLCDSTMKSGQVCRFRNAGELFVFRGRFR